MITLMEHMELLGNCSVLGNSLFPGDLEPGHTTRAVGWLERLESLEMQPGTDWDQLPSNPSISSCPAACHLADAIGLSTAIRLQEKGGYAVAIIAETFPTDPKCINYCSHWAVSHSFSSASLSTLPKHTGSASCMCCSCR